MADCDAKNPLLAMFPKNESPDGFAGKYIPVPLEYGNPQGRSHTFANAQNQQTASDVVSYFVYAIQDYQLVTITNLLMEQTKSNAGAFVDEASRTLDNGFRNISNNMAFELFFGGTASRGQIGSGGVSVSGTTLSFTLANAQNVVQFEVGMSLQASTIDGGAALAGSGSAVLVAQVASVNRGTGAITAVVIQDTFSATWVAGDYLQVYGDIGTAGASTIAGLLGLSGLAAWVPSSDPISTDNFWGVNRSADPTRLGEPKNAQIKPALIDLETWKQATRGKRKQPERLSEWDLTVCDSLNYSITQERVEEYPKRSSPALQPSNKLGLRYNAASQTISEGITNALAFGNREGAAFDLIALDFVSYSTLINELGAKVQYVQLEHDEVEVAFEAIHFHSAYGKIPVLADRSAQAQTAWCLTLDTWKLRTLGEICPAREQSLAA